MFPEIVISLGVHRVYGNSNSVTSIKQTKA